MQGSIPAPNYGSFVEKSKKNIGSQMAQIDKKNFKKKDWPWLESELNGSKKIKFQSDIC